MMPSKVLRGAGFLNRISRTTWYASRITAVRDRYPHNRFFQVRGFRIVRQKDVRHT